MAVAGSDRLRPYNGLIDTASIHGWLTYLGQCKDGRWWLEVRDRQELLARAKSPSLPEVGRLCGEALEKSGRLESP